MLSGLLGRIRHGLGVVVGELVIRRWPWPVWRLRGYATLPVGSEWFRFYGVHRRQHAWWAHQARRRRWEPAVVEELSRALQPEDVFFDLGGYLGAFTLLGSRLVGPRGKVVTFEPDPAARALLARNVAANGATNVTIADCAVGDATGTVRFVASGDSVGRVGAGGNLDVPQVTLDGYCEQHGIRPTVMKVDIEGGEAAALSGSAVVRSVRELVLEIHEPPLRAQGVDPAAFLDRLGPHGPLEPTDTGNYAVRVRPRTGA